MAKYKQKLIDKVLFYDIQPISSRNTNIVGSKPNNKDGKKRNTERVVKQR